MREGASFDGSLSSEGERVYRMDDGRYAIVTADNREGGEGKYRLGFSETAEYDENRVMMLEQGATAEEIKQNLAGIANGSLVVGEKRLERAQTRENAPASGEGVVDGQVAAQNAVETQKAENGGIEANEGSLRRALQKKISDVVDKALSNKGNLEVQYNQERLSQVPSDIAEMVSMASKGRIDISSKNVAIHGDNIWHEYIRHKDQSVETGRRQIALTPEGIKDAIEAIYDPDVVECVFSSANNPTQQQSFAYAKKSLDGYYIVVEAVGGKRNPNIIPIIVHQFTMEKWNDMIAAGKTIGELLHENDANKSAALDVDFNRRNRVTAAQFASKKAIANTPRSPRFNNSIPQNGEKSTDLNEKVSENIEAVDGSSRSALPKTREARERKLKRAQAHQKQVKERKRAERSAAERIATEIDRTGEPVASEQKDAGKSPAYNRGYTDAEANEARGLVGDFDTLPPSVRRSIVELVRSGKASGASKSFLKHSASLIAYWRRGLWIIADDKTRDDGFYTSFRDGSRLITVKPNREANAVADTLMHELGHDVWARADADMRRVLYELATVDVKAEEIDAIRKRYRDELTNRGELDGMAEAEVEVLLDEEVATNLIGEVIGKEEFLGRFDGTETSTIKRILRTLSNMKKRFTGKDRFLYRKADDLFTAFTKMMAMEEMREIDVGEGNIRYSLNKDAATVLHKALYDRRYSDEILLRDETPEILTQQKGVRQLPMAMQISHIRENVFTEAQAKKLGLKVDDHTHYHGLGEKFFLQIIDGLDNVTEAYRGTKTAENSARRENYFLLISTFKDVDGNEINVPVYIEDYASYNRAMIDVNKISTVFGRDNFRDYIAREVKKRNLVRIKKRSPQTGDSNALIAKQYGEKTSANSIAEKSKLSTGSAEKVSENVGAKRSALAKTDAEVENRRLLAAEKFGFTNDVECAGFVLPDGRMLNLSQYGLKGVQHKRIEAVFEDLKGDDAINQFVQDGNVRLKASSPGIEIGESGGITISQRNTIRRFIDTCLARNDRFFLDITAEDGSDIASFEYDSDTSTSDILYDIEKYYERGLGSIRHALPKPSGDEMIEGAVMRGYGDKLGVNSQTSEKTEEKKPVTKPKKTAAQVARENAERRAAAEMAQVEEQAARTVRQAQKSAANKVKNAETFAAQKIASTEEQAARRVRNAEKSAENATKNAEKKLASETERLARESMEHIYRSSRESARLNKNIEYLKNEVLHRKSTEGGLASSIIFGEPSLRAVVKVFAGCGSAGGVTISQRNTIRRFIDTCLARNCSKLCRGGVLSAGRRDNILAAFLYTRYYTKCKCRFVQFCTKPADPPRIGNITPPNSYCSGVLFLCNCTER